MTCYFPLFPCTSHRILIDPQERRQSTLSLLVLEPGSGPLAMNICTRLYIPGVVVRRIAFDGPWGPPRHISLSVAFYFFLTFVIYPTTY